MRYKKIRSHEADLGTRWGWALGGDRSLPRGGRRLLEAWRCSGLRDVHPFVEESLMSNAAYPEAELQLLEQIVSEPRFRSIAVVDRFAWQEIAVLSGSYLTFALSSYLYLVGLLPYAVTFVLSGVALYAVFTPLHDATHRSASSDRRVNDWIGNLACFLLVPGFSTALYRYLHLEHHRYTGKKGMDPDEPFVSAWPAARVLVWCCPDILWVIWYFRHRNERPARERAGYWMGLSFAVTWHAVWLLSPYAWEFFLLWMVPQRLGLGLVVYLFAYLQHPDGVEQQAHPFQATRLIRGGSVMRHLFLGQSEHLMHHLFPSIPFYRYHHAWLAGGSSIAERGAAWQWPFTTPRQPTLPADNSADSILKARVSDVRQVGSDVIAYELAPCSAETFPVAEAGAHIDLHLEGGMVRQYSLCGDPADRTRYRIAVKREANGRGGSKRVHDSILQGDIVEIGQPRNLFALVPSASRYVLIAGGIGVTPLMAMAYVLKARGARFTMHVCARSHAAMPFHDELQQVGFAAHVRTHLDDGDPRQRFGAHALPAWEDGAVIYLCGPRPFMEWVIAEARSLGWPDDAIRTESFVTSWTDQAVDRPFDLILARSGRTLHVAAGQSALDVLHANRVAVAASCTQGLCGACVTGVCSGAIDHRDRFLSEREKAAGNKMALCVSRACGERIVLDL